MRLCNLVKQSDDWHEIKVDSTIFVVNTYGCDASIWPVAAKDWIAEAESSDLDTEMERVGRTCSTGETDKLLGFLVGEYVEEMKK